MGAGKPADGTDACLLRRLLVAGERTAASRRERVRVATREQRRRRVADGGRGRLRMESSVRVGQSSG